MYTTEVYLLQRDAECMQQRHQDNVLTIFQWRQRAHLHQSWWSGIRCKSTHRYRFQSEQRWDHRNGPLVPHPVHPQWCHNTAGERQRIHSFQVSLEPNLKLAVQLRNICAVHSIYSFNLPAYSLCLCICQGYCRNVQQSLVLHVRLCTVAQNKNKVDPWTSTSNGRAKNHKFSRCQTIMALLSVFLTSLVSNPCLIVRGIIILLITRKSERGCFFSPSWSLFCKSSCSKINLNTPCNQKTNHKRMTT